MTKIDILLRWLRLDDKFLALKLFSLMNHLKTVFKCLFLHLTFNLAIFRLFSKLALTKLNLRILSIMDSLCTDSKMLAKNGDGLVGRVPFSIFANNHSCPTGTS